jgi:hypothetical protein
MVFLFQPNQPLLLFATSLVLLRDCLQGHAFEVHEMPSKAKGCKFDECQKTSFVVSSDEDQGTTTRNDRRR